jgi:outer membrane immunogenic protein
MKHLKLLFAGVATIVSGGAAEAADAAQPRVVKSPPTPPMPAFSWTGCHAGLHGGWGWGRQIVNASARSSGVLVGSGSNDLHTDGALFGGQVGCDYQFPNGWVVGIEGAAAATNVRGSSPQPLSGQPDAVRAETQWLASVTGRLGYAGLLPQTLVYAKGGGAWTREEFNIIGFPAALNGEFSKTFSGWTAGAGIAWAFSGNWSVFVEYNHFDFRGNFSNTFVNVSPPFVFATGVNIGAPRIDTLKVGFDLRF